MTSIASSLKERASALAIQVERLDAQRELLISQKAESIIEIQNSTHYLDQQDAVSKFLNHLQTESQKQTKGMHEDLLSSLITEVLPYKHDRVVFSTSIKNNKMALDINIKPHNKDKLLNVKLDKGGSIQNIVAAGLRFITVSRSRNRKIILMDEADQSLNTKQIPRFARIIKQLSEQLNVQVIYISHHAPEAFQGCAKIVNLQERNGIVSVTSDNSSDFEDDDVGIRFARLVNFKQHSNTLINFSKNVTVITGGVDVGKSGIIEAFSVIMENGGRDGLIKDESPECSVELGLEEGRSLKFSYAASGSNRTKYELYEEGASRPSHISSDGRYVPDWLDTYLATPKLGDFDIHISRQMQSNFILDDSFSAQRRAEILSLENESEQIQKMIVLHGETILFHKRNIKTMNKRLNQIKNDLERLALLNAAMTRSEKLNALLDKASITGAQFAAISEAGNALIAVSSKIKALIRIREVASGCSLSDTHDFTAVSKMGEAIDRYDFLSKNVELLSTIRSVKEPTVVEIKDLSKITDAGKTLFACLQKIKILKPIRDVQEQHLEELKDCTGFLKVDRLEELTNTVNSLSKIRSVEIAEIQPLADVIRIQNVTNDLYARHTSVKTQKEALSEVIKEMAKNDAEIVEFEDQIGHKCPLCSSHIEKGCKHE